MKNLIADIFIILIGVICLAFFSGGYWTIGLICFVFMMFLSMINEEIISQPDHHEK